MTTKVETTGREAVLVEDAARIRIMGFPVLEALPSRGAPYNRVDPFILVHEARIRLSDVAKVDTRHPHRGFDNLWYVLEGSASTGHSTGPGGTVERARLAEGALLALRTGRGAWHAEALGADELQEGHADAEFRSVLFWVNLARKDKQVAPSAQVVQPEQIPVRQQGDATVRVLVGEGSAVRLGTPALILDVELPTGGQVTTPVPPGFQGFAYVLEGEAAFGANRRRARPAQLVLLGPGEELGHRRRPRHSVPAHDGPALWGGPGVQRAVRGLAPRSRVLRFQDGTHRIGARDQGLPRRGAGGQRPDLGHPRRRLHGVRRPLGLREVHRPADDRFQVDADSALASGARGTPTLFVNGRLHLAGYDESTLGAALATASKRR